MAKVAKGHVEPLPSGSFRVSVYAGVDPLTRQEIRLRSTVKDERLAQIELGRLLKEASEGRTPDADATVARLLKEYAAIAEWDVSTRQTNEGFIRRTIKPALGHLEVRKVRGPILDKLYTRLKRCGDLSCTGKPFTEHRKVPILAISRGDSRPAWQQVSDMLAEAIRSGNLAPGDELPSITELSALQGIGTGVIRHAIRHLAADGLITIQHGRATLVAGKLISEGPGRWRPGPGHDCRLAGCRPHVCHPMKPNTIRGIHGILSGAFAAAQRWEWIDRNPAESAKPPTAIRRTIPATSPEAVAKVIAEARRRNSALGLYLWLVVVTGVRRGELCGLQVRDIHLDQGLVHIAFNYVVRGGKHVRKDTKTHQDRWLAIDPDTCALITAHLDEIRTALAEVGVEVAEDAYLFSNDPAHARPWNPDWATHKVADTADAVGVELDIKGGRHYTASQLLAGGFDLRNTAARLGHSGGGATTLRHYADPVPEVDRRAAAYLARLTAGSSTANG
ncbi:MAG: GntR family transcriptional regulator [Actinobacteria bacterium]|nr:GntR family transcriptional regulator [Actinomycetota bacterium]